MRVVLVDFLFQQPDPVLRAAINRGEVMYVDQHLSETVEMLRTRQIAPISPDQATSTLVAFRLSRWRHQNTVISAAAAA